LRHLPERPVSNVEREVVAGSLEERQRSPGEGRKWFEGIFGLEREAVYALFEPSAELADSIARGGRSLRGRTDTPQRFAEVASPEKSEDEA
jgi:hypothetical protein